MNLGNVAIIVHIDGLHDLAGALVGLHLGDLYPGQRAQPHHHLVDLGRVDTAAPVSEDMKTINIYPFAQTKLLNHEVSQQQYLSRHVLQVVKDQNTNLSKTLNIH